MTPVMLLTDGYIANGSEPWLIPDFDQLAEDQDRASDARRTMIAAFMPYKRNADLARPWAFPGTAGLEHRIGGLEKQDVTGNVSYDPANHEHMVRTAHGQGRRHQARRAGCGLDRSDQRRTC